MAQFVVERLEPSRHDRKGFVCESEPYTRFLREYARQNDEAGFSATYVGIAAGSEKEVMGYLTLSMGQVAHSDVERSAVGRLPPYPIPVLHVGMLATSENHTGKGVGKLLLRWAMLKAVELAKEVGCHALQLEAAEDSLVEYYEKLNFVRMSLANRLMYLPIATIRDGLANPPD